MRETFQGRLPSGGKSSQGFVWCPRCCCLNVTNPFLHGGKSVDRKNFSGVGDNLPADIQKLNNLTFNLFFTTCVPVVKKELDRVFI